VKRYLLPVLPASSFRLYARGDEGALTMWGESADGCVAKPRPGGLRIDSEPGWGAGFRWCCRWGEVEAARTSGLTTVVTLGLCLESNGLGVGVRGLLRGWLMLVEWGSTHQLRRSVAANLDSTGEDAGLELHPALP
jgi:hypothetical protein